MSRHLEQAAVLLVEAEEDTFIVAGCESREERIRALAIKREEALIHAVLAVAEEIAAHRKVLARRR